MAIQTKTKIREWGNSYGIVIPKELVIKEGFKVNDCVTVSINKKKTLEGFFGKGKGKIKDAQKEKDEARKIWKMN
jgi:hypothetical protein